jgi:hypothetical protein
MPVSMLKVRAATMARLKASADVTALIPKASNYPGTVPATKTFPFSRFGSMIASPFAASGMRSSAYRISVQGFSNDILDGSGAVIVTAEDSAINIGDAFQAALDGVTLDLGNGDKLRLEWLQSTPKQDPTEASAWMVTTTFAGEVAG